MNTLYYGDNLGILREYIKDESVDLIYLDPPFNSRASYNVLFNTPNGQQSESQMTAFEDTWHWTEESERTYAEICSTANPDIVNMIVSFRKFIGQNDMMAYLTMMTIRLIELHRVLKPTGSIYLHCDPTASHYLKILMDTVFNPHNFINEITWKRADAHSDARQGAKHFGRIHDIILFYTKTSSYCFNTLFNPLPESTVKKWYRNIEPETGRRFNKADVTGPGGAAKGNPHYEWNGVERYWRYSKEKMAELHAKGKLVYSKSGMTYEKRYLDESKGVSIQDWWDDISMLRGIHGTGERLGYPTQKPVALLERIIKASSKEGDIVMDPFCGCGTAVHAAQKLGRNWIGIDITHLAINLIKNRLKATFDLEQDKGYHVIGEPRSLASAKELAEYDKYQFQWWITSFIGARPFKGKKRGADTGIDAVDYFSYYNEEKKLVTETVIVSVKGGAIRLDDIRALKDVVSREKAALGFFVTLHEPTKPMETEAVQAGFYEYPPNGRKIRRIQILTVKEILEGKSFDVPGDRFKHTKKAGFEDGSQKGLFGE